MAYCTLFDSFYFLRGVLMAKSLLAHTRDSVYVLAMDELCHSRLLDLNLDRLVVIGLSDFLSPELKTLKETRSKGEFCWTCTPFLLSHVLSKHQEPWAVYLDADLLFYSDPGVLTSAWLKSGLPLLLSRHRYLPEYDQTDVSGEFCVQFNGFLQSPSSLRCLNWWMEKCAEWCFARAEPGRFGDQKYLDYIESSLGVTAYITNHPGEGVAPWNCANTSVHTIHGISYVSSPSNEALSRLIFYHFHGFRIFCDGSADDCQYYYLLPPSIRDTLYKNYIQGLFALAKELQITKGYDLLPAMEDHPLRVQKRKDLGTYYFRDSEQGL